MGGAGNPAGARGRPEEDFDGGDHIGLEDATTASGSVDLSWTQVRRFHGGADGRRGFASCIGVAGMDGAAGSWSFRAPLRGLGGWS